MHKGIVRCCSIICAISSLALLSSGKALIGCQFILRGDFMPFKRWKENTFTYTAINSGVSARAHIIVSLLNDEGWIYPNALDAFPPYGGLIEQNQVWSRNFVFTSTTSSRNTVPIRFFINGSYIYDTFLCAQDREGIENKIIDVQEINNTSFEGNQTYFRFNSSKEEERFADKFIFKDFNQFYTALYYHRLQINDKHFTYINNFMNNNLTYKEAYIEVKEDLTNEYYKHVSPKLIDGYRRIPLLIQPTPKIKLRKGRAYTITLNSKLYVNPSTLIMSTTPLPNFVETKYFYFPKTGYKTQKIANFRIVIKNVTPNEYDIVSNLTYETDKAFLGNCMNSKYCIDSTITNQIDENQIEVTL